MARVFRTDVDASFAPPEQIMVGLPWFSEFIAKLQARHETDGLCFEATSDQLPVVDTYTGAFKPGSPMNQIWLIRRWHTRL